MVYGQVTLLENRSQFKLVGKQPGFNMANVTNVSIRKI